MIGCHNFKNIEKFIAERCAMYECTCTLNLCDKHPLFNNDCMFGKKNLFCKLKTREKNYQVFLVLMQIKLSLFMR